jgi:hypothetical protein
VRLNSTASTRQNTSFEAAGVGKITKKLRRVSPERESEKKMKSKLQHKLAGNYRWLGGLLSVFLLVAATFSATAHTQNFPGLSSLTAGASVANNGALTTHFTASYYNGQGGFFTGAGERIVKTGPKAFTKDSETLLISDIATWPAGTYIIGSTASWFSDFDGQTAVSGTIVVTDNGDGTGTMYVVAYY